MTMFEDLDLAEAFGDDFPAQDDPPRRHAAWITVVALGLAVLLVAGGLLWLGASRHSTPPAAVVTPVVALPALGEPQTPSDQISATGLDGTGVRTASTRFLGQTDLGRVYAGVGADDKLCLLAVPEGDLTSTTCLTPREGSVLELRPDADGPGIALVTTGGTAPDEADGWTETSPGLWVVPASS
ncbi:hypothetical protein [Cellulomonas edaphi]|uniref:Anti-sigma factor n=1 Tax=Cellulomonas edaphi TaxID=3053468 RepID=A0ABT7S485_9CELL|nr:hypothetical protein [Cellulomons edaphi]MDM7830406.1 hypothetical protein [Cellulomons edaphi]